MYESPLGVRWIFEALRRNVSRQTAEGRMAQRSNTTPGQAEIFRALKIAEPGRFLDFEIPTPHT